MPLFTVVIPLYNSSALIVPTIQSVLAQDCQDFEIIVVDDESKDDTLAVIAQFGDRVRILHQPNSGPGPARNLAIANALGKYIAFLDHDDLWLPWTLETYRQTIERHNSPAIVMGERAFFEKHTNLPHVEKTAVETTLFANFFEAMEGGISTVVPSGVAILKIAFDAGVAFRPLWLCQDIDLFMQLGAAPGCAIIRRPITYLYRSYSGQLGRNAANGHHDVLFMQDEESKDAYPGGIAYRKIRRDRITFLARAVVVHCCNSGLYGKSIDVYFKTFVWQAQCARFRFLLGYPFKLCLNLLKQLVTGKPWG